MFKKKRKRKEHKYINGAKGAISLFLIVLMLPFIEIASALINLQKYNASVSILDEVVDSSIVSTISDYDSYVNKRFGLYTINQKNDISEEYEKYFKHNLGVLPSGFNNDYTITVTGQNTFLKDEILRAQIDEYAKYTSPVLMAEQFLNLEELIKKLEKAMNATDILKMISSGAELVGSVPEYIENVDKLKTIVQDLNELIKDYNDYYSKWSSNVTNYAQAMRDLEDEEELLESLKAELAAASNSDKEYIAELKESIAECEENIEELEGDIEDYKTYAVEYQKKYSDVHTDISTKVANDYKPAFEAAIKSVQDIQSSSTSFVTNTVKKFTNDEIKAKKDRLKQVDNELVEISKTAGRDKYLDPHYSDLLDEKSTLSSEITQGQTDVVTADCAQDFLDASTKDLTTAESLWNEEAVLQLISDLSTQKTKVDNFSIDDVTTATKKFPDGYNMKITGIISENEAETMYDGFETMKDSILEVLKSLWEGIKGVFEALAGVNLVFDPELCSIIDADHFMREYGIEIDCEKCANSLVGGIRDLTDFATKLKNMFSFVGLLTFYKSFTDLYNSAERLVNTFINFKDSVLSFIGTLADPEQMITNLFYAYYLVNTLPCRTDYANFKDIKFEVHDEVSKDIPVIADLLALFERATGNADATSKMFSGAELEYLMAGSKDEIKNQSSVFLALYLIRLLASLPTLASAEVASIATGPQAPIVLLLYALLEPLVDTVLLVNGGEVPFIKIKAYLTPSGIPNAVEQLTSVLKIGDNKKKLQNSFAKIIGYKDAILPPADGNFFTDLFNFDYKENLMFILFLFPHQRNELYLFRNLIQIETLEDHRKNSPLNPNFDIRNTYTAIEVQTETKIREFMPDLIPDSLFKVKRTQHRGY